MCEVQSNTNMKALKIVLYAFVNNTFVSYLLIKYFALNIAFLIRCDMICFYLFFKQIGLQIGCEIYRATYIICFICFICFILTTST